MRYAVLGTGTVGQTLGTALVRLGHEVRMGARSADNEKAVAWAAALGDAAGVGTFADAARFGEAVLNATAGTASLGALESVPASATDGKVLLDVANPLDFSGGFPPKLAIPDGDSLAEQIQRARPEARVVKSLNTMSAAVMVDPARVPGDHVVFLGADDAAAKAAVRSLLQELGWPDARIVDLGGLESARGTELYLALWVRVYGVLGTGDYNLAFVRS